MYTEQNKKCCRSCKIIVSHIPNKIRNDRGTDPLNIETLFGIAHEIFIFLAHWIRISEIFPWDRKSYLTNAILPRLSHKGYIY